MANSTHKVEVVPVVLQPHPNADSLSVANIYNYSVVVRTEDWVGKTIGAYIPPDNVVVSNRPEFAFLKGHERIKVKKLRGVVSMGLLVPAPEGSKIGDDVAEQLGVTHYEPPQSHCHTGKGLAQGVILGDSESAPEGYFPVYDVDALRRYSHAMIPGEMVIVTEKVHGCNSRYHWDERMRASSHKHWKKYDPGSIWWKALAKHESVTKFCVDHPDCTVFAECYGNVQDLSYGHQKGEVSIAVFDILRGTGWISANEARDLAPDLPWVPTVAIKPFVLSEVLELAEGPSLIPGANHIREGIVVKPLTERTHPHIGRVCFKVVSNGYLMR